MKIGNHSQKQIALSATLVTMQLTFCQCRAPLYCLALLVVVMQLGACSSTPRQHSAPSKSTGPVHQSDWQTQLQQHFANWRGTPYRMGGLNKKGIDCSGFVYITFREVFGVTLPRTTRQLAKTGSEVPRRQITSGDLLIFKTGRKQRHVGIYLGNGKFLHASTSKGVIASNLHSDYWSNAFRQSRRVLNL